MKTVCLWSAGKDSCFACYKAGLAGHKILSLVNFTTLDGKKSLSHGLDAGLIQRQAQAIGIPLFQKAMPKGSGYREAFKDALRQWKAEKGIEGIVFGDIYLEEHKVWIDKVCQEAGLEVIMPLWGKDTTDLVSEFIEIGFQAIVVSTLTKFMGAEWLGRRIDESFLTELKTLGTIDPCGEKGEFHSFVYAGPGFSQVVDFKVGKKVARDQHWFLELT